MHTSTTDVLVVGQGVVGAIAAWRARVAGLTVMCLDPQPGDGASYAAAGMLAPVTEADFAEHDLVRLNVASAAAWPAFAAEGEHTSETDIGFRTSGILTVAYDAGDAQELLRLRDMQRRWGLEAHELTIAEAREREPLLGPRIAGAYWVPGDHQVDPRALHRALAQILCDLGVETIAVAADRLLVDAAGAVTGAVGTDGVAYLAERVVVAAGHATRSIVAPLAHITAPTRAVKGQIIRLDGRDMDWIGAARIVRGFVQQRPIYVVWRPGGEIIIGATCEELPDDRQSTVGGVFGLLRDARAIIPGLDEVPIAALDARARPGTPDNLPLLGQTTRPGLIMATGHYRNGILLSALTSSACDAIFAERPLDELWSVADPMRFTVKESV